jgi:hypothetical protein
MPTLSVLRHDRKTSSLYAHNTGHSTGPHVHFEIRDGDVAVNPRNVLPKSKLGLWEDTVATPLASIR